MDSNSQPHHTLGRHYFTIEYSRVRFDSFGDMLQLWKPLAQAVSSSRNETRFTVFNETRRPPPIPLWFKQPFLTENGLCTSIGSIGSNWVGIGAAITALGNLRGLRFVGGIHYDFRLPYLTPSNDEAAIPRQPKICSIVFRI